MNPVRLVQLGIAADPFQQIRDERRVVLFRQRAKHFSERADVAVARSERKLHPGDDDRNVRVPRARLIDDRLEIRSHLIDGHSAECIVDPQRENQDIDFLSSKKRRQTAQSSRCGVAARSGIDHLELIIRAPHLFGDQGRIRLFAREAVARGQTISESQDGDHFGSIAFRRLRGLK